MVKDTSISIRMDSQLKEQTENILTQFGLNITTVVNMLFHQIVREQSIPLSLSLNPSVNAIDELKLARAERLAGYNGVSAESMVIDMERIIEGVEHGEKKI